MIEITIGFIMTRVLLLVIGLVSLYIGLKTKYDFFSTLGLFAVFIWIFLINIDMWNYKIW